MSRLILSLFLLLGLTSFAYAKDSASDDFEFYLGEFLQNELQDQHAMKKIIREGLVQSILSASSESEFRQFIVRLQEGLRQYPDRRQEFERLDRSLDREFKDLIQKGKRKRWLYAAGGAVVGAIIGVPIGKGLSSKLGTKIIYLTIPLAAVAGGSMGFLLGDYLSLPSYSLKKGAFLDDLRYSEELRENLEINNQEKETP